jgi:hypothetical protein
VADFVSNTPVSGPRNTGWEISWDIGGMAWSYEWGMFYAVSGQDDVVPQRKPDPAAGN